MTGFTPSFSFKQFAVTDSRCGMKVGTDGVVLGAWTEAPAGPCSILEVGVGCGLISLMLAQRYPEAHITGVELDPGACRDFRTNVDQSPWARRISLVEGDYRTVEGRYDLIVSNPPFFTTGDKAPAQQRQLARHADGLSPLTLAAFASTHLAEGGMLAMIAPRELDDAILSEAVFSHLVPRRRTPLSTSPRRGVTRTLWQFGTADGPYIQTDTLTVGSEPYRQLTAKFYLNL